MSYHIGLAKMNSHGLGAGEHRLKPHHQSAASRADIPTLHSGTVTDNDDDTTSFGSLAEKYLQEGRLDQVERVLKQTLEIGEMVFGATDGRLEHSLQALADFYCSHAQ